ncbi:MAG: hypothetical protein JSR54_00120 [Proteobacteria bacterium]|nr:hypothetical protein [Pseudomonadota bacterium]
MRLMIEGIGWVGAVMVLLAYGLLTTRRVAAASSSYQWLNGAGSLGLMINSAWNGAFPSVFLNGIWLALTVYALTRSRGAT